MPRTSPTLKGFEAAFRWPSLTLAEIAWRWIVGAVAGALFFFLVIEYFDTLPVTKGDAALLRTRQLLLVGRALSHILRGTLNRAVLAALLAALALCLLRIVAASIGRAATVRFLLEYFGQDFVGGTIQPTGSFPRCATVAALNFLRAASVLAAMLGLMGAGFLAGFASSEANPQPVLVFILFIPLAGLICIIWPVLNWLLSLACIFAVRDGKNVLGAISAAVTFSRARFVALLTVSTWTGLAHVGAFFAATLAASFPLAFLHVAPTRIVVAAVIFVTLVYFATVDWLRIVRLGGYACIVENSLASAPSPAPLPQTAIGREESIFSDCRNSATGGLAAYC